PRRNPDRTPAETHRGGAGGATGKSRRPRAPVPHGAAPSVASELRRDQFAHWLLAAARLVAEAGVDPRAVAEDTQGVRVAGEAPVAVVLAHPGVADAAEGQVEVARVDDVAVVRTLLRVVAGEAGEAVDQRIGDPEFHRSDVSAARRCLSGPPVVARHDTP